MNIWASSQKTKLKTQLRMTQDIPGIPCCMASLASRLSVAKACALGEATEMVILWGASM